jgi:hypothetical protein
VKEIEMRTLKNWLVLTVVFAATTGCGQKSETIGFDEAVKKDLVTFSYRLVESSPMTARNSVYAVKVAPTDLPTDLAFTPEEKGEVFLDRADRGGVVVRFTARRADNAWVHVEAEMDESRIASGTTFVRGREGFAYRNVDLIRHVAPKMLAMLRAKPGGEAK